MCVCVCVCACWGGGCVMNQNIFGSSYIIGGRYDPMRLISLFLYYFIDEHLFCNLFHNMCSCLCTLLSYV